MDQTPEREELLVDFSQVVKGIWQRRKIIAAVMIAACLLGLLYGFFSRDISKEESRVYMYFYIGNVDYLVNDSPYLDTSEVALSNYIVDTYTAVLSMPHTLQMIIDKGALPYTPEKLRTMIMTSQTKSTRIYQISVYSPDLEEAFKIARVIAEILPAQIEQIVGGTDTRLIGEPMRDEEYTIENRGWKKRSAVFGIAAALVSFVLAGGAVALKEIFNNEVYDERYLRRAFPEVPVIGAIPDMRKTGGSYADALRKEAGR